MQYCSLLLIFLITGAGAVVKAQTSRASSAASYVERGNDWLAKGNLDLAITDYDLAIATYPGMAIAYLRRGEARRPWWGHCRLHESARNQPPPG